MVIEIRFGLAEDKMPDKICPDKDLHRKTIPHLLKILFVDTKTNKIIFRYVPRLDDKQTFKNMWALLDAYDIKRKELHDFIMDNKLESPTLKEVLN